MNAVEMLGTVAVAAISAVGALVVAIYAGKVELKKRKPETITHQCRLLSQDVYTFIKNDKKQTPPLCAYLDPPDYVTCRFDPKQHCQEGSSKDSALKMKEINRDQCYIAHFNEKYDLI